MVASFAARISNKDPELPVQVVYLPGEEPLVIADTEPQGDNVGETIKKKTFLEGFFPLGSKIGAKSKSKASTKEPDPFGDQRIEVGFEAGSGIAPTEAIDGAAEGEGGSLLSASAPVKAKNSFVSSVSPMVLLLGLAVPVAAVAIGVTLWGQSTPQKHMAVVAPKATGAGAERAPGAVPPLIAPSANLATVAPREAVDPPPRQVSGRSTQTPNLDDIFALKPAAAPASEMAAGQNGSKVQQEADGSKAVPVGSSKPAEQASQPKVAGPAQAPSSGPTATPAVEAQGVAGKFSGQVEIAAIAASLAKAGRGVEEPGLSPAPPSTAETPADRHADNEALALVTELGTLLKEVRTEVAALKVQDRALRASVEAKIADFDRRLDLKEAKETIAKIKAVDLNPPDAKPAEAAPIVVGPKVVRVAGSKPVATASVQAAEARKTYRIQAASPGLAMLVEANNTGDDAPLISVSAGHELSGYGKVLKIEQEGSSWKVRTERGTIQ